MREKGVLYCFDSLHSFRHLQSLAALQDGLCHQHQAWPKPHGTKWDSGQNKSSLSHSPVIRWDSECSSVIFRIQRIYSLGSRYALIIFNELVIKLGKKLLELCCTARDLSMEDKTWACMRGATVLPVGPRARRPHKSHSHTPPSYTH